MALKLYNDTDIQNIADSIRTKNGSSDTYKVSEMARVIQNIPSGGSDWAVLYQGTTTEEAILKIAVTNISCKEFMVYVICKPTADVSIYVTPNNTSGSHYDEGYGRTSIGTGTTTGNAKYGFVHVNHQIGALVPFETAKLNYVGNAQVVNFIAAIASRTLAFDAPYTSIAVATYQNLPADTEIIVLGR